MKAYINKKNISGELTVPGSKSHTIRAVAIATLAEGKSIIKNPLPSGDCKAAYNAASLFGSKCRVEENKWLVEGVGSNIKVPEDVIDVDNSGTTLYFMTALASLVPGMSIFTGDEQIRNRPISGLIKAIKELGANGFTTRKDVDAVPAVIEGPRKGGTVTIEGRMSQYVSSLLITAPMVDGVTRIEVDNPKEKPYLAMTIDWMEKTGITVDYDKENFTYFEVKGPQKYNNFDLTIPSDWSGVAFPLCAAVLTDSDVIINDVKLDDKQGDKKIVDILVEMGADIKKDEENNRLIVKGGKKLKGITVNLSDMPDSLPMLSVVACYAEGVTRFEGTAIIRVKETDRVAVMNENLTKMGAKIEDDADSMTIYGVKTLKGTNVESYNDHRVAMALSVAGLRAEGETIVNNAECVKVSFPNFYEIMNSVGANITVK